MLKQLQKKYIELKQVYDEAFENENWDTVEKIEDELVDVETRLVEEGLKVASQYMNPEEVELIRKNWTNPEFNDKVISVMLKLK